MPSKRKRITKVKEEKKDRKSRTKSNRSLKNTMDPYGAMSCGILTPGTSHRREEGAYSNTPI